MADSNNNGENYENKNRWVWVVIIAIAVSSIYVMTKIFIQESVAVSVLAFNSLSNSLNLL